MSSDIHQAGVGEQYPRHPFNNIKFLHIYNTMITQYSWEEMQCSREYSSSECRIVQILLLVYLL